MRLIDGWKRKVSKLWSVRFAVLSAVLGILEQALPALSGVVPPGWFAALSIISALAGAFSRIVAQPKLDA